MNTQSLAAAVRNKAAAVRNINVKNVQKDQTLRDAADLLRVLAHIVEGKPLAKAFGAPGDWGYETALGAALAAPSAIPPLGTEPDPLTLLAQYRTTCEAQQKTIDRLRDAARKPPVKMLRITQCHDASMWYAGMVGQLVPLVGKWPEAYASREPAGYINRVEFADAEVVDFEASEAGGGK